MKVYEPIPQIVGIERTRFSFSGTPYNKHSLYNTHDLYLGAQSSGMTPMVGCVEDKTPSLYSVVNG